jgi:hypothetical protein
MNASGSQSLRNFGYQKCRATPVARHGILSK